MGYIDNIQCSFQITVYIQENFKRPAFACHKWFYFLGGAGIVYGDSDKTKRGLFLSIVKLVVYRIQLLDAGNAPGGPETNNNCCITGVTQRIKQDLGPL